MKPIATTILYAALIAASGCATLLSGPRQPVLAGIDTLIDPDAESPRAGKPTRVSSTKPTRAGVPFAAAGVTEVGGEVSISSNSTTIEGQDSSTTTIKFEPAVGYFLRDGLSVFGGALLELETESAERGQSTTTTTTGLFTGLAYFAAVRPDLLYIGPGVQAGLVKVSSEIDGIALDASGFLLAGGVAAKLQIGTSALLSLGANLGYQTLDISAGGQAVSGNNLIMNLTGGASVFF